VSAMNFDVDLLRIRAMIVSCEGF